MATKQSAVPATYAKSQDTKRVILDAALLAFGRHGLEGANTRAIAAAAGVKQPMIHYHFGSKEGLYLACADEIIENFARNAGASSVAALKFLEDGEGSMTAADHIKAVIYDLLEMLTGSDEAEMQSAFILREVMIPGRAFQVLFKRIWNPGVRLISNLLARAAERNEVNDEVKMRTLMLFASIVHTTGSRISSLVMNWQDVGDAERDLVHKLVKEQIDALITSSEQD